MRTKFSVLLLLSFVVLASVAWGQNPYTMEPAPLKASAPVSATVRSAIEPQGMRVVTFGHGMKITVCEVWWAKTVFTYAKAMGPANAIYGKLQRGTLLGVLYFPTPIDDGRDQKIRAGYYTMRYVQMPQTRAHENVSTYPDFVALSPAGSDAKSHQTIPMETLLVMSRRASQTTHAAIISLAPVNPSLEELPAVGVDDTNQCVLQVKIHAKQPAAKAGEEMKLAIVLIPAREENGGS
jgi:hypothetical protein